MLIVISTSMNKLCTKIVVEEMAEEQVLSDKTGTQLILKVDLQMMGCKNDMEKAFSLNIQNKSVDALKIKKEN